MQSETCHPARKVHACLCVFYRPPLCKFARRALCWRACAARAAAAGRQICLGRRPPRWCQTPVSCPRLSNATPPRPAGAAPRRIGSRTRSRGAQDGNKVARVTAGWRSGGFSQRQIIPKVALRPCQPWSASQPLWPPCPALSGLFSTQARERVHPRAWRVGIVCPILTHGTMQPPAPHEATRLSRCHGPARGSVRRRMHASVSKVQPAPPSKHGDRAAVERVADAPRAAFAQVRLTLTLT